MISHYRQGSYDGKSARSITVDLDIANARDLAERAEKADFSSKIGPYTIGFSSGTSGFAVRILLVSEQAAWAGFMLARVGFSILGKYRIGLVLRANSNTESIGSNRIVQFYDLMKPVDQLHQDTNDDLDILICPPSVLSYFVDIKRN